MKESSLKYLFSIKGNDNLKNRKNKKTAKQYERITARFAAWLSEQGIKRPSQLAAVYGGICAAVQAWTDHLQANGNTPATIHTYAAAVCTAAGIPMDSIKKPKRTIDAIVRSRDTGNNDKGYKEQTSGRYDRLIQFQKRVGIRRAELARLTGNDLITDESGYMCVLVRKGKGGKVQLQRILPADQDAVMSYFDGSDNRIFSSDEMRNHIDLHHIRALHAQECYRYYAALSGSDRQRLRQELIARYRAYHPEPDKIDLFTSQIDKDGGIYRLRGKSKALAQAQGQDTVYDRLALMATSVFHLSHWRLGVTVTNYLLSV